ncbi:MAG: hypothetical protein H8E98_03175 [Bacteroidetes bacterium]|nr:hypothetical protein [Bacteroidota bacterium]
MIRRLIILLLIVGCGIYEEENCAGASGGTGVLDDCGVCDGIDGYVAGSCYDCAGVANGTGVIQKTFYNGDHVDEWGRFLGENVWSYDDTYIFYKLMNSNQIIIKDIDNGTEYNYSGVNFPIWIENNYLVSLEGNDSRELIISNIDGSYQETIVVLPDSLSNPSGLHFIPN